MHKSKAFTLLELMVAVSIFAGLIIMAIAILTRSSASSDRVSDLNIKSQEARKIIDAISSDFRYVNQNNGSILIDRGYLPGSDPATQNITVNGFALYTASTLQKDQLIMVGKYPGQTNKANVTVYYFTKDASSNYSINVKKYTDNLVTDYGVSGKTLNVTDSQINSSSVAINFTKDTVDSDKQVFINSNNVLAVDFYTKKSDFTDQCTNAATPVGTCFEIKTTLNEGVI